jgi:hypothetical protein
MDLVVAGADRIIIREGFREEDIGKIFDEIEANVYLSVSVDALSNVHDYEWSGYVYLANGKIDLKTREFLSTLQNLYIVARRKAYLDFSWIEENDICGVVYPIWEM